MHDQGPTEPPMLGYRIERVADATNAAARYDVFAPGGDCTIASFGALAAAQQFVVLRELRSIELRPRHPAW